MTAKMGRDIGKIRTLPIQREQYVLVNYYSCGGLVKSVKPEKYETAPEESWNFDLARWNGRAGYCLAYFLGKSGQSPEKLGRLI